jgi:hypothetical protein
MQTKKCIGLFFCFESICEKMVNPNVLWSEGENTGGVRERHIKFSNSATNSVFIAATLFLHKDP